MPVGMAQTPAVKKIIKDAKAAGFVTEYDSVAGTATVKDGEIEVYKALQKGKGAPWIVRYQNTENIQFS